MISEKMLAALNSQLNREHFSALFYLSMSAYTEELGFKGISRWFKIQHHEEFYHAMKIYDYIHSRNGKVELLELEEPDQIYKSVEDVYQKTLVHEEAVSEMINTLMDIAVAEKDHSAQIFLQWFVTEQVEEEGNVQDILTRIKLINNEGSGMIMLDQELGTRQLTVPVDFSNGVPKV